MRFNNSFSISLPQFVLKKKTNGLSLNRFGIVVSKKIDKRAVVRNRVKRLFRTTLENLSTRMVAGHDILFIVRPTIISKTKEENQLAIKNALEKAGLIEK